MNQGLSKGDVFFVIDLMRHTKSDYNNYLVLEQAGSNPMQYVDYRNQVADLNPEGVKLAELNAFKFAQTVNPKTDMVVVFTTREMRGYQTGKKYLDALVKNGVEIIDGTSHLEALGADGTEISGNITTHHKGDDYPVGINETVNPEYENSDNKIILDTRIIPARFLSLFYPALWIADLFEPPAGSPNTTFDGLDESKLSPGQLNIYKLARQIIETENDHESNWGDNWLKYHSQYPFKEVTPSIEDNLSRILGGFIELRTMNASEVTKQLETDMKKRVRYLLVSHEENILGLTRDTFGANRVNYCDMLHLEVPYDSSRFITGTFNGMTKKMGHLYTYEMQQQSDR